MESPVLLRYLEGVSSELRKQSACFFLFIFTIILIRENFFKNRRAPPLANREQALGFAQEQRVVILSIIAAMLFPALFLYVDQRSNLFTENAELMAFIISFLALIEHSYVWKHYRLGAFGKSFGVFIFSITVFTAFSARFLLSNVIGGQFIAELLLFLYLPFWRALNLRNKKRAVRWA